MASNEPDASERLFHTYTAWQGGYLAYERDVMGLAKVGRATDQQVLHSQGGRMLTHAILDNRIESLDLKDWMFDGSLIGNNEAMASFGQYYSTFPCELFNWNRSSRRVFHIPHSLESTLAAAEFPDIKWSDLLWPFESFVITLEKPLLCNSVYDTDRVLEFDSILVSRFFFGTNTDQTVCIRLMQKPRKPGKNICFKEREIAKFKKLLLEDSPKVQRMCKRVQAALQRNYGAMQGATSTVFAVRAAEDRFIRLEAYDIASNDMRNSQVRDKQAWLSTPDASKALYETMSVAARIAFGWMLYMETISAESAQWHKLTDRKTRMRNGGATGIITRPENIFRIVGRGRIDPNRPAAEPCESKSQGFVRPHWRRAHKRRPRGSAPDAEKTIRVAPKLVRADLVPLYGIIGGTKSVMISD